MLRAIYAWKLRRGTTRMLLDNLPGQEHVRQRERRSLTTQPQKCSLLPTLRESFHETKVKRGDRGTIKFRGGIFEKVRAPRPPLLEIYSSLFHFGGAMREPGGGASSPKEFQEFSSPRTEGNSSRGLDHFVLPILLFSFPPPRFFCGLARPTRAESPAGNSVISWKILEGVEPRASNSSVI